MAKSNFNAELIGKFSIYASYVFRFLAILLILTPITMATGGIGGIIGILFYKFLLKIVPFNISLYNDYKVYTENNSSLEILYSKWKTKLNYSVILILFIITSITLILINDNNVQDRIFFSIILIVLLIILVPQIQFLQFVKKTILLDFKPTKQKRKFSLLRFYFDDDVKLDNLKIKDKIEEYKSLSNHKIINLKKDEIIILAVILGIIIGLSLGFLFGEKVYYNSYNGKRVAKLYQYAKYSQLQFNYLIGISTSIISGGLCYIIFNRKKENSF